MQQPPKSGGSTVVIVIMVVIGLVVVVGGIMAVFAIYGTRRYLASAKTSEAKNNIGAIARAAADAYEREGAASELAGGPAKHRLCGRAFAVPAAVPKATKYQPDTAEGKDFNAGDATGGWKCLKFSVTTPIYYQYEYHAGGGYKGPSRGGPDPGKDGFEVSAEGDLNGDGKTSLFTQVGRIENGHIKLDPTIFISDELE